MLKKLLKYDLGSIFKYWWILAVSSVGLAALGGICVRILSTSDGTEINPFIAIMAGLGIAATVVGLSAVLIVTEILIFVRFYKNFFTDEGYLTFTIPVKRSQLLNSKIITTLLANIATVAVLIFDVLILLAIGAPDLFHSEAWQVIWLALSECIDYMGIYAVIYAIEAVLLGILLSLASVLILYICVTLASIVVKKAKVIAAIGIYYGAYTAVTVVAELIYIFGLMLLGGTFEKIPDDALMGIVALILFVVITLVAAFAVALYLLEHYMLDKKLNLS